MIALYQAFDALHVAVRSEVPPPLLEALEAARREAEQNREDEPLECKRCYAALVG